MIIKRNFAILAFSRILRWENLVILDWISLLVLTQFYLINFVYLLTYHFRPFVFRILSPCWPLVFVTIRNSRASVSLTTFANSGMWQPWHFTDKGLYFVFIYYAVSLCVLKLWKLLPTRSSTKFAQWQTPQISTQIMGPNKGLWVWISPRYQSTCYHQPCEALHLGASDGQRPP